MAKYRQIYTEFWSDSFILELTPEEKFFYLYILTNTKSKQSGIYELSKRFIETETGLNRETIDILIKKFSEYNKILYCEETKEIMVLNWIKYNIPNNQNIIKCVNGEIRKIKNKEFVKILFKRCVAAQLDVEKIFENFIIEEFFDAPPLNSSASMGRNLEKVDKHSLDYSLENNYNVIRMNIENTEIHDVKNSAEIKDASDTSEYLANQPFGRDLQGASQSLPSNRIRSKKQEVISKKQELRNKEEVIIKEEILTKKSVEIVKHENNSFAGSEGIKSILKIYEENVHAITPLVYDKILEFTKHVSSKVIIMAIEEAVKYNAKSIKYISEIINSWISKGIKTAEGVNDYQKKWANKKCSDKAYGAKSGGFCDYQQRDYDFDALEKRLLGIA